MLTLLGLKVMLLSLKLDGLRKIATDKALKAIEKATAAPVVDDGMGDMFSGMAMMDDAGGGAAGAHRHRGRQ